MLKNEINNIKSTFQGLGGLSWPRTTVFPRIVSAETILFWKSECGNYSREETILFLNLEIVANSNSCRNIVV